MATDPEEYLELVIAEGDYTELWELLAVTEDNPNLIDKMKRRTIELYTEGKIKLYTSGWPPDEMTTVPFENGLTILNKDINWKYSVGKQIFYWIAPPNCDED